MTAGVGRAVSGLTAPAATLFCVSHVFTSIAQGERVRSIRSTQRRAVRRRASVAIRAGGDFDEPHGT